MAMGPPGRPRPVQPPVMDGWSNRNPPSSPGSLDSLFPPSPVNGEGTMNLKMAGPIRGPPLPSPISLSVPTEMSTNPLMRFYTDSEGPWNPQQIRRQSNDVHTRTGESSPYGPLQGPNIAFNGYRNHPRSELESNATGTFQTDSGYGTKSQATASVLSTEDVDYTFDCPNISSQVGNLQLYSESNGPPQKYVTLESQQYPRPIGYLDVQGPPRAALLVCPECLATTRCQSEHKKHILRHIRPFKCKEPGCTRKDGFSTSNDLDRHKKSVHKILPDHGPNKSYRCSSLSCKNKDKIWPRLDNFRSHLKRMHSQEDVEDLLKRSEQGWTPANATEFLDGPGSTPQDPTLIEIGYSVRDPSLVSGATSKDYWRSSPLIQGEQEWDDVSHEEQDSMDDATFNSQASSHPDGQGSSAQKGHGPNRTQSSERSRGSRLDASNHAIRKRYSDLTESRNNTTLVEVEKSTMHPKSIDPPGIDRADTTVSRQRRLVDESQPQAIDQDLQPLIHKLTSKITKSLICGSPGNDLIQALSQLMDPQGFTLEGSGIALSSGSPALVSPISSDSSSGSDSCVINLEIDTPLGHEDPTSRNKDLATRKLESQIERIIQAGLQELSGQKRSSIGISGSSSYHTVSGRMHGKQVKCDDCGKILPRTCDMNKHKKRHTRPFGCTFPKCSKSFGSKNDWKRHENSQHFQLESWRCGERSTNLGSNRDCAKIFYRKEGFQSHLKQHHSINDEDILKGEAKLRRIGRNGQERFWCGFCKELVTLRKKGKDAWDERFDHVAAHFNDGRSIEDWEPADGVGSKLQQQGHPLKSSSPGEKVGGGDKAATDESSSVSPTSHTHPSACPPGLAVLSEAASREHRESGSVSAKRPHGDEVSHQKSSKRHAVASTVDRSVRNAVKYCVCPPPSKELLFHKRHWDAVY
ncbi:MAG: hypothetical protein M1827_006948 [Pycnora praestabilis]|nr:MAG: hypothetical protein M1827_006948 [Pycnora praestabilis]